MSGKNIFVIDALFECFHLFTHCFLASISTDWCKNVIGSGILVMLMLFDVAATFAP